MNISNSNNTKNITSSFHAAPLGDHLSSIEYSPDLKQSSHVHTEEDERNSPIKLQYAEHGPTPKTDSFEQEPKSGVEEYKRQNE